MEEKQATLIIPEGEKAETEKPTETVETTINIAAVQSTAALLRTREK